MTYLSHLAARTLNQLPVVEPRLPSHFEVARREAGDDAPAPLEYATFTPGTPSITAGAASLTPTLIAPEQPPTVTPSQPAERAPALAPRLVIEDKPSKATLDRQGDDRWAETTDRTRPTPHTTLLEHNAVTHFIEREAETIVSNHTLIDHATTIEQRTLIERERLASPTIIAPVEAHAPRIAPQVTPYVPPVSERTPAPEPAQTIHVSIGRIEVRAVPTSTPAFGAASAPKHQLLSLDEYLRGVRR